jgi:hypothetical protein
MQDAKEKSHWLISIKEKARDWWVTYDEKLWAKRILVYLLFLVLWSVDFALIFDHFDLFNTEAHSTRYMLSALVQSQAAIIAIVVSLTLIAVQLSASAYSPRVIDIFKSPKKNPDLWILIGFYGFSIFYGLFLLKMVVEKEGEFVNQTPIWPSFHPIISFEHCVSFAYWLGAFTFIILVPYTWNILDLLKPESIINRLATDITKDKFLNSKESPIQPIMDIVHGSIMKYDIATTRAGLKVVTERLIEIINSESEKEISKLFCDHLERISKLAVSKIDEDTAIEVIKNLWNFGKSIAKQKLKNATHRVELSLKEVGVAVANKEFVDATRISVEALRELGLASAENKFPNETKLVAIFLGEIGMVATKQQIPLITGQVANSLKDIGSTALKMKLNEEVIQVVAYHLVIVGIVSTKKGLVGSTEQLAESLVELTLLNGQNCKKAIQAVFVSEEDRESFQKFIDLYKQKLEKLRSEKKDSE